ncbi:hypothetical protein Q3G72_032963 [Acer saccharum]|nr:hypothetical protein Q3G72_032963 [Acer saccharum]
MKLGQMYMKRELEFELVRNSDRESTQEALLLQGHEATLSRHRVKMVLLTVTNQPILLGLIEDSKPYNQLKNVEDDIEENDISLADNVSMAR